MPMVIAVVDDSGILKAFLRMDGAKLLSVDIAQNKAWTAASFGIATDQWHEFIKNDAPLLTGIPSTPRLIVFGGGYPIVANGQVVGGYRLFGRSLQPGHGMRSSGAGGLVPGGVTMSGWTMAEKILMDHLVDGPAAVRPGQIVRARVDRILLNDVSGPLAFRQFEAVGATKLSNPDQVVLVADHFAPPPTIAAAHGIRQMRVFAERYGVTHYYEVGQGGIEHALLPEQGLVAPGELIIGGDSHSCTYGAFNAFGTGLGSTDIAVALALGDLWFQIPQTLRFEFTGRPTAYVTGKDVILRVLQEIGVDGATYMALEFSGEGIWALNMDERMALCNMTVEAGAKAGMVEADPLLSAWAQERAVPSDKAVAADKDAIYRERYVLSLADMPPLVAVPHSPGDVHSLDEVSGRHVDQVYIGNCANGTLTDLRQAAEILRGRHVARGTRLIVVPATQHIYQQALEDGIIEQLIEAGAAVSTPTCGACFGGHMGLLDQDEVAVATTNRNFRGRMGHAKAEIYLGNAFVAAAAAVAGELIDPVLITGGRERGEDL